MDESLDVADCLQRWKNGDEAAGERLIGHIYPVIELCGSICLRRQEKLIPILTRLFPGSISTRATRR